MGPEADECFALPAGRRPHDAFGDDEVAHEPDLDAAKGLTARARTTTPVSRSMRMALTRREAGQLARAETAYRWYEIVRDVAALQSYFGPPTLTSFLDTFAKK